MTKKSSLILEKKMQFLVKKTQFDTIEELVTNPKWLLAAPTKASFHCWAKDNGLSE